MSESLNDLKALSEPVSKLIDAVSKAIGILYEPTRIRRKSKAIADSAILLEQTQNEIKQIRHRANERINNLEIRRQTNIEKIVKSAINALPPSVSKDPVDADWVYQFFQHCQDIGNDQMQTLWARLLAGEVEKPGSFSLRTMRIIKELTQEEANIFSRLCSFVWKDVKQQGDVLIVPDIEHKTVINEGINFEALVHLQSAGLLIFRNDKLPIPFFGYKASFGFSRDTRDYTFSYGNTMHFIKLPKREKVLNIGVACLTSVGEELSSIAGSKAIEEYRKWIVSVWRKEKVAVIEQSIEN